MVLKINGAAGMHDNRTGKDTIYVCLDGPVPADARNGLAIDLSIIVGVEGYSLDLALLIIEGEFDNIDATWQAITTALKQHGVIAQDDTTKLDAPNLETAQRSLETVGS